MRFVETRSVFQHMKMWSASQGGLTYVISKELDEEGFRASVKPVGAIPFDGTRKDLGMSFVSFEEAAAACEKHAKGQEQ